MIQQTLYNNIFDSHSHYDGYSFDCDRDTLLTEMFSSCVSGIIHCATDLPSCEYGIKYSEKYPRYYTAIGIHPEHIYDLPQDYIQRLEELLPRSKKIVAVGEIGLDYHYEGFDREKQLSLFTSQLEFAARHSLPVIIHSRNATEDTMELLRKYRPNGVLHCFSGSYETACEVIRLGMYIGFTGALTFKNNKKASRALEAVPMDRLLLETDCPYMAPEGYRGQRSESAMIYRVAEKVAEVKGLDPQSVLDITAENAKRLFGIQSTPTD